MIVFKMTHSFWKIEDADLSLKLDKELSGIFNWAMEGLKRRIARGGYFIQPETGREYLELMAELGNPIGSFVEDTLIFDKESSVEKDDVFACYKHWAQRKGRHPGAEQAFKRRFLSATQEHFVRAEQMQKNGDRNQVYLGVRFNDKAEKYLQSIVSFDEGVY
jgi:phage/plasmid-associated DNA primase